MFRFGYVLKLMNKYKVNFLKLVMNDTLLGLSNSIRGQEPY
jgi:hypothetical protein